VRNNFLLDWAAGKPLELPPPPAYPPPLPKAQWGHAPGDAADADGSGEAGGSRVQRPGDVRALLAAVAGDALDVELSDEEEGLLLPGAAGEGMDAAGAEDNEEEEGSEEESSSGSEGDSEEQEDEEDEEGQLPGGEEGQLLADVYAQPADDIDDDVDFS
jgi:hypothetical protein